MQKLRQFIPIFFAFSVLIAVVGAWSYLFDNKVDSGLVKTSLTERDIAIAEAIESGKTEYSYSSRFIPGVGYVANPAEYQQQQQEQLTEQLKDSIEKSAN